MRVLSGAHPADSGEILVNGEAVSIKNPRDAKAYNIETIYQTLALADNVDAPANVFLGRELTTRWGTLDDSSMEDATRKVMKRLNPNFTRFAQPVRSLSGGQRQAVAIARAVHFNAQDPDHGRAHGRPWSGRDGAGPRPVRQLKTEGIGIFLISHDIHDVYDLSDRVSVMYHGRIVGDGRQVRRHDRRDPRHDHPRQAAGRGHAPGARRAPRSDAEPRSSIPGRTTVPDEFFADVPGRVGVGGLGSTDPLTYKVYEPDRLVLGKRMADHLRIAVCLWHSFNWPGSDVFGSGTFDRPWLGAAGDPMAAARAKLDGRVRVHREARRAVLHASTIATSRRRARTFAETTREPGRRSSTRSTATWRGPGSGCCGARPTCSAIRAMPPARRPTPIPRCSPTRPRRCKPDASRRPSASAARTTCCGAAARATRRCSTPTSGARRRNSPASSHLVAEHKHKIGFEGTLLIEPKPQEPTKHQYDYDSATVHGFLVRHGLGGEYRVNIEANHATLAGHCFHHEVAYAIANGVFGSRSTRTAATTRTAGTPTSSRTRSTSCRWRCTRSCAAGGFTTGGFNFDSKLRRQSLDRTDLFHGHIGGIDTLARALLVAARDDRGAAGSTRSARRATRAGRRASAARSWGRGRRWRRSRIASLRTGSTRSRDRASRSCSRTSSTATSGPPTGRARRAAAPDYSGSSLSHERARPTSPICSLSSRACVFVRISTITHRNRAATRNGHSLDSAPCAASAARPRASPSPSSGR